MRFRLVAEEAAQHPVSVLCSVLGVSRGRLLRVEETWALAALARGRTAEGVDPNGIRRIARDVRCSTNPG